MANIGESGSSAAHRLVAIASGWRSGLGAKAAKASMAGVMARRKLNRGESARRLNGYLA